MSKPKVPKPAQVVETDLDTPVARGGTGRTIIAGVVEDDSKKKKKSILGG